MEVFTHLLNKCVLRGHLLLQGRPQCWSCVAGVEDKVSWFSPSPPPKCQGRGPRLFFSLVIIREAFPSCLFFFLVQKAFWRAGDPYRAQPPQYCILPDRKANFLPVAHWHSQLAFAPTSMSPDEMLAASVRATDTGCHLLSSRIFYPGSHPVRGVQVMKVGKLQLHQGMFPQAMKNLRLVSVPALPGLLPGLPCSGCC